MIETGERLLLVGNDREYFVTAGEGKFSTDRGGMIDLSALVGMNPGEEIRTHLEIPFTVLRPPGQPTSSSTQNGAARLCSRRTSAW